MAIMQTVLNGYTITVYEDKANENIIGRSVYSIKIDTPYESILRGFSTLDQAYTMYKDYTEIAMSK